MSVEFPVETSKATSRGLPLFSLAFALLLHAVWLVVPQPRVAPVQPGMPMRLVAYPNLDSQVWSPTLFSLPSSLGFSGVMKQRSSNVVPPLQTPLQVKAAYDFHPKAYFNSREITLPDAPDGFKPASPGIQASTREEPMEFSWTIRNSGDGVDIELTRQPPPVTPGKPMVMTGVLSFDAAGQVISLIVDPVGPPEPWRSEMLQSLRRSRIRRGVGPVSLRFRFGYERGGPDR